MEPNLRANGNPTSLTARTNLLSITPSSFLTTAKMFLAKTKLRTLPATLIVKSTRTRSSLDKPLNHTPERMAFNFSFKSSALLRKPERTLDSIFSPIQIKSHLNPKVQSAPNIRMQHTSRFKLIKDLLNQNRQKPEKPNLQTKQQQNKNPLPTSKASFLFLFISKKGSKAR
jgi:hypothetical protein